MSVTETCRDISELTELAQKACKLFLDECTKQGLKVLITETYRSQERQDYLYAQGRTRAGNKVTWTKNSRHTSRRAWDICQNIKGHEYDNESFFKKCGEIAKKLGITWGGTWNTPDTPHFEVSSDFNLKNNGDDKMSAEEKNQLNNLTTTVCELQKIINHQTEIINLVGSEIEELKQGHKKQNDELWNIKQQLKSIFLSKRDK